MTDIITAHDEPTGISIRLIREYDVEQDTYPRISFDMAYERFIEVWRYETSLSEQTDWMWPRCVRRHYRFMAAFRPDFWPLHRDVLRDLWGLIRFSW